MNDWIAWSLAGFLGLVCMGLLLTRARVSPARQVSRPVTDPPTLEKEIVARMREGVVVVNETLTPVLANETARAMLGFETGSLPATLRSDELVSLARRAISEQTAVEAELSLWPRKLTVQIRAIPLADPFGAAVFLHDVTKEAQLQQVRKHFVVNASHELKTPVAGLMALGEAIRQALPEDLAAAERLSRQLVRESERLSKLTQDLLDLSRVEDPASVRPTPVELRGVARHEGTQLKDLAEDRSIEIRFELDEPAVVSGDEQQISLMVRNLIDNAIRYSEPNGVVTIEVREEDGFGVIAVADTGLGIPLRDQARVFERFYRVDEGRSRDRGGTGLGLSIVRHVAELHGGHVSLESELGEGSMFVARLPLKKESFA